MWSEVDVLLTANPDLLLNYPEDKKIIKFNSTYNKDIKTELSVSFIKQAYRFFPSLPLHFQSATYLFINLSVAEKVIPLYKLPQLLLDSYRLAHQ